MRFTEALYRQVMPALHIVDKLGYKNIIFFGPAYAFGRDQWVGAKAAFDKRGIKVEYVESPVGTSDYTSYLLKIGERSWISLCWPTGAWMRSTS